MQTPKQSFSMSLEDVDEALNIAQNMIADALVIRSQSAAGLAASQPPPVTSSMPQPTVLPVTLNEANLQPLGADHPDILASMDNLAISDRKSVV